MRFCVAVRKIVMVAAQKKFVVQEQRIRMAYFVQMTQLLTDAKSTATRRLEKFYARLMKMLSAVNPLQFVSLVPRILKVNSVLAILFVRNNVNGMRCFVQMELILEDAKMPTCV